MLMGCDLQRDGSKYYAGDLLMYGIGAVNTTLLTSVNAQRDNGGKYAHAGQLIQTSSQSLDNNNGYTLLYMQSKPGSSLHVNRYIKNGAHVTDESAQLQVQSALLGKAGQTQYYYYVQNPIASNGNLLQPNFESVILQEVLQFY